MAFAKLMPADGIGRQKNKYSPLALPEAAALCQIPCPSKIIKLCDFDGRKVFGRLLMPFLFLRSSQLGRAGRPSIHYLPRRKTFSCAHRQRFYGIISSTQPQTRTFCDHAMYQMDFRGVPGLFPAV